MGKMDRLTLGDSLTMPAPLNAGPVIATRGLGKTYATSAGEKIDALRRLLRGELLVSPEEAFRQAFQSIKPTDAVCVGLFPRIKDEVKENVLFAGRHGGEAFRRK